jgi:hypothetical protein
MSNRLDIKKYIKENITFIILVFSIATVVGYLLNVLAPEPVEFEIIKCWELDDYNFCYADFTETDGLVTSVICTSDNEYCIPYEVFLLSAEE